MATALPVFDGEGEVEPFIKALNDHFCSEETKPEEQLDIAFSHIQGDARVVIDSLIDHLVPKWSWSWPALQLALRVIEEQFQEEMAVLRKKIIKSAAIGGRIAVVAPFAFSTGLGLIGFGAAGVNGGSLAAAVQASIGQVAKRSLFAFCQSAAAGGYAASTIAIGSAVAGGLTTVVASTAAAIESFSKSRSWKSGKNYKPSKKVLDALANMMNNGKA